MSIVGNIVRDVVSTLFPSCCIICGRHVAPSVYNICPFCRYEAPLTNFWKQSDNPVKSRFDGIVPIVEGSSFIFFNHQSPWQRSIHSFKYGGKWLYAYNLGLWYGAELKASGLYDDIDVIVPVPLHPFKILNRGYNQSTYLAEGIAKQLGKPVDNRSVRRLRNNPAQARKKSHDRWLNTEHLFGVRHPERLKSKHILIVDDVLTTGATISSCIAAIQESVPDCRISIATLAVSRSILLIR